MYSENELKLLASQLGKPSGENGIEVAEMMHATNINMTLSCIDELEPGNNDQILEIGHGNCGHLEYIMKIQDVKYTGLEISVLMHEEAKRINEQFITSHKASFILYDGEAIPFQDESFEKSFTVNTIYFWQQPTAFLNEIYRVLKPGGVFCIGLAWKHFMQTLPFTPFGFTLYDEQMIRDMVKQSGFELSDIVNHKETVKSKTGVAVERDFAVIRLRK